MKFSPPVAEKSEQDETETFRPRFDENGLICAIVQDASSGDILMVAWMNAEALSQTLSTGIGTFWSRSRQRLWVKGETSGHTLRVTEVLTDCDQDAILLKAVAEGPACHTGRNSCFYRKISPDGRSLSFPREKD